MEDTTDMQFLQGLFKKFVPAKVSHSEGKRLKRPMFTGWLNVTAEESIELARCADYEHGPFIFLTGKATQYMTVDLDRSDGMRTDHANKQDGVSYYTNKFGDLGSIKTLLIKTPSGGYHLVYKYREGIKSGQLEKDVLIDILSDNRGMCFGPDYGIVTKMMPASPPTELVQHIFNVQQNINVNCNQVNNNNNAFAAAAATHSDKINKILEADWRWDVVRSDRGCYKLVPLTRICMVDKGHSHTDPKHSCLVVSKTRVTAKCFSHGESAITGVRSKQLRSLLFHDDDCFEDVMHHIVSIAKTDSLGRRDGFVWKVHRDRPWIYHREASYEDFANSVFAGNPVFMRNPRRFADMLRYMESIAHPDFPFLKKDKAYIGFRNCFLNIETFHVGTEWNDAGTVPRHSIDQDFSWDNMYTPLFDGLLQHQLGSGEVYGYLLALIGRLLFEVKQFDNYNVIPLIKGDTGTGKSTLLAVIQAMFSSGSVGVLNSNNELTFGLETRYDKEILIAHEIGDQFTHRLASDLFKQMVCGEDIHIPRKNKSAIDIRWRAPLFLCSNVHLSYKDVQGSISRRLIIFRFDNYIADAHKDTSLDAKILSSELPAIIAKCLHAYKLMLHTIGNESFWKYCPDYFHDNTDQMKEDTDYIYMFLTLPPGDNIYRAHSVYFMKDDNASMLLQDFKRMFMNYMKYRHTGVNYKWTSDYSSIRKLGYEVEYGSICKACGQVARTGCCNNFNIANRCRRFVIKYLKCVEIPVHDCNIPMCE